MQQDRDRPQGELSPGTELAVLLYFCRMQVRS